MSTGVEPSVAARRIGQPTSGTAAAAWELALDLFFESWRISDRWSPAVALSFRRRALGLSRLIGVAALSRAPAVVEIHLSSSRRALAELERELGRAVELVGRDQAQFDHWVGWSTTLGAQLSRWNLESKSCCDHAVTEKKSQIDS